MSMSVCLLLPQQLKQVTLIYTKYLPVTHNNAQIVQCWQPYYKWKCAHRKF